MKTSWVIVAIAVSIITSAQSSEKALEDAIWKKLESEKVAEAVAELIVSGDAVTLRGKPANAWAKMKAIEAALSVEGIESVDDELDVAGPESAEALVQDLISTVLNYPHYGVFDDVGFQMKEEGVIVVTGYVTMGIKKTELEERLAKVTGVREIQSVVEVLPTSQSIDDLRERLYRGIYGHDLFRHYANRRNPPIHIIVDSADVMLTGAVRNRIEKLQAESIVRGTFGVIRVDNRLQINP